MDASRRASRKRLLLNSRRSLDKLGSWLQAFHKISGRELPFIVIVVHIFTAKQFQNFHRRTLVESVKAYLAMFPGLSKENLLSCIIPKIDGDWAVGVGNWMWVSSSAFEKALDCAKCMCPVNYGRRMDPTGAYVKRYLPQVC